MSRNVITLREYRIYCFVYPYRLASPALSQSSSQRSTGGDGGAAASVGVTSLATGVTSLQRQESYKLPPSLANYFNEQLIPHVTGWPMEALERQVSTVAT